MTIRRGIKRFKGTSQFSNKAFFEFMVKLAENCVIDPGNKALQFTSSYDYVSVIEKMDGTYVRLGWDREFYMQTRSSRRVTMRNVDDVWPANTDLGSAFRSLSKDMMLQNMLRVASDQNQASIWLEAELYPSLRCIAEDEIRFNVVPYSRSVIGDVGAIVIFRGMAYSAIGPMERFGIVESLVGLSAQRASNEHWKFFSNREHAVSEDSYVLEIDDFLFDVTLSDKIKFARECLNTRKRPPEVKAFYDRLSGARQYMQSFLDDQASTWRSFLHDDKIAYPYVEGVILRIKDGANPPLEAKGTSPRFDEDKKLLWEERSLINDMVKKCRDHAVGAKPGKSAATVRGWVKTLENPARDIPQKIVEVGAATDVFDAAIDVVNEAIEIMPYHDLDTSRKNVEAQIRANEHIKAMKKVVLGKSTDLFPFSHSMSKHISTPAFPYREAEGSTALVWIGRAQPWHRGHTEMLRTGLQALDDYGIDSLIIFPVRGKQSQLSEDNPLVWHEQMNCINATIKRLGDDRIALGHFVDDASPYSVLSRMSEMGAKLAGWLAGADRCSKYEKSLFDMDKHAFSVHNEGAVPFTMDEFGRPTVKFIETERVMSGTQARAAVQTMSADEWILQVTGLPDLGDALYGVYRRAYDIIKHRAGEQQS